jgi:hypothetical protein
VKKTALLLTLLGAALSGCHNDTYCLNCQTDDGMAPDLIPPDDLLPEPDLTPPPDLLPPPDLTVLGPDGGPCMPTNGGVEKCDGLDNDCNGKIDDVDPSKLASDPENCGKCGNTCDFTATHQAGVCAMVSGMPTCQPGACLPGFVDLDHMAANGCEYACTPSTPPTEVCDGKDNDCNGITDDGFGYPNYNLDKNNCGACANVCNLPGAVVKCATDSVTGNGVCAVDHCINDGSDTYRHNKAVGETLNTTGCEYHCPFHSTTMTTGSHDCDDTICSFPPETCNGIDDDCNRIVDDNPNDVGAAFACGSACPMGNVANCVGQCHAGSLACISGVKVCQGSTGPSVELCDGKDNDCNGLTDDTPQDSWVNQACCPTGKTSDCQNTGTGTRCVTGKYQCQLGMKTCSGGTAKSPETCNNTDDDCNGTTDDVPGVGTNCTTDGVNTPNTRGICTAQFSCNGGVAGPGPSGLTCVQKQGPKAETCNLLDDNCDGATDEGNPGGGGSCGQNCPGGMASGCVGQCSAGTTQCQSGALVCVGSTGPSAETCNGKDDDCNGTTDSDTPGIGNACSTATVFNTGRCVAKLTCTGTPGTGVNGLTCTQVVGPLANELCNGIDDNCNGQTDESINDPAVGVACGTNCPGGTVAGCKGACMAGTTICSNGGVVCSGSIGPSTEFCDNKDNNCDGVTDNNPQDAWMGQPCCPTGNPADCQNSGGSNHCVMGAYTCAAGGVKTCSGGLAKAVEVCNGIDDDCDGITDNVVGLNTACTTDGTHTPNTTGSCTARYTCNGGVPTPTGPNGLTCVQNQGPVAETCNGKDDNCNGTTDEGNPGGGASCGQNCPGGLVANCKGACVAGTTTCTNGTVVCNGSTGPTPEVCNNVDDNCDGATDEAANLTDAWKGQACCSTGNISDCSNSGAGTFCHTAIYSCVAGARVCSGSQAKSAETCDGKDNDCNGTTDDVPGVNQACTTDGVNTPNTTGKCTAAYSCNGGVTGPGPSGLTCKAVIMPSAELCNGIDDNCNGLTDDSPTDVGAGFPCYNNCKGGVVGGCVGECKASTLACAAGGIKTCPAVAGAKPGPDTCDALDNDCDGITDNGFGYPLYNSDANNCGGCNQKCTLPNANNGCHADAANGNQGACYVVSCANVGNQYYNYVPATPCGASTRDGTGGAGWNTGAGCNYACPVSGPPLGSEICDGKDNDCNGATDELKTACYVNGLVAPSQASLCASAGVCNGQTIPVNCQGANGWMCDYHSIPNINVTANTPTGKLTALETLCDGLDNNCNGTTDLDGFGNKGQSCTAGIGVCQSSGTLKCKADKSATQCQDGTGNPLVANSAAAVDELCDGKDNNCDGQTDERVPNNPGTCSNGGSHVCKGYFDAMVQIGATGKYIYAYEASRPGATAASPGGNSSRACSVTGVLPWATVTKTQADAACAAVLDKNGAPMRLCTDVEWQTACEGPGGTASSKWSMSSTPTTYASGVCNDVNEAATPAVWTTGHNGTSATNFCYADWAAAGQVHDMSGNVEEWTSTQVVSGTTTYYKLRGGSYSSPQGGTACEFDFNIAQPGFANTDVGFRCCSDNPPN